MSFHFRNLCLSGSLLGEMQVGSNYSGWEHNDKGDFKTRVDESLAKLKAAQPKAKVIAISAQFRSGHRCSTEVARQLNVFKALSKPFSRTDLLAAVEAAIGSMEPGLSAAS